MRYTSFVKGLWVRGCADLLSDRFNVLMKNCRNDESPCGKYYFDKVGVLLWNAFGPRLTVRVLELSGYNQLLRDL